MVSNLKIARIALKVALSRIDFLHRSVMGFYNGAIKALNGIKSGDKGDAKKGLREMEQFGGISVKMLSIINAVELALQSKNNSSNFSALLKQAFNVLFPDMQRTYDFYGTSAAQQKKQFETLAEKLNPILNKL